MVLLRLIRQLFTGLCCVPSMVPGTKDAGVKKKKGPCPMQLTVW